MLSLSVATMQKWIQRLYLLIQRCRRLCMALFFIPGHVGSERKVREQIWMLLCLLLDRQRKEKQDLKASKKFYKNRHELYADELVGCCAIRVLYHRAALQAFESTFSCMFDPTRSVWPSVRTQNWWTTLSQRGRSFWPSTFSTQMSLRRCGLAIAVTRLPSTM